MVPNNPPPDSLVPNKTAAAFRYAPGTWLGVVRSGTAVLLRPDTEPSLVQSLWELLATEPEVHEVLDAVTSASGGSLSRLPWFGIVDVRGPLRVFLRGEIDLQARQAGRDLEVSGRDVTTWTERRITKPESFSLVIPPETGTTAGEPSNALELPLGDGVVLLQGLRADLTGAEAEIAADPRDQRVSADTVLALPEQDQALPAAPEPAEPEHTSNYDHLWEQTVMRKIEDAAVREDPDAGPEPATAATGAVPLQETPGALAAKPAAETPGATAAAPLPPTVPVQAATPVPPALTGLIDSVPWITGGNPPSPAPPSSVDADHDGQTIMKGDLVAAKPPNAAAPAKDNRAGPMVLARVCAQGHANPPTCAQCGLCGLDLPGDGVQVRRPRLGRMRLSTGELIDLDQSLVVGRQPSVSRVQGSVMPKLVQVTSPGGDISRSHVEVRLEGWHVMLCDLKATNGTVLVREGQAPRRLAQGELAILLDGDIADLGDGVSLRFEEIP